MERVQHFDLVIIGTGSGNSILDSRFADQRVAIVEKGVFGGTCLNVGCIPTKMYVYAADVAATPSFSSALGVDETLDKVRWLDVRDRIFGRIDPIAAGGAEYRGSHPDNANVTVFSGTGRFTGHKTLTVTPNDGGAEQTITAERIVLAAGTRPVVPDIEGIEDVGYHTSDTVMRLDELPESMLILGGGFIAAEFAHVFSSFGVRVTVILRSGAMLRAEDDDISTRFTEIVADDWHVQRNRTAVRAERVNGRIRLHTNGSDGELVHEAEELLIATGRTSNADLLGLDATGVTTMDGGRVVVDEYQRTAVDGIYALGDISSPYELKHVANHEAAVVQHNLLHDLGRLDAPRKTNHHAVPHAVFSHPQVASVGLTEREAKKQGVEYVTSTQDYAGIAFGWAMEDTTGFCKLLADPRTGTLLGAHIIGPQASTLLQPLIQAMSFGLDSATMARGQYWVHPAMPELLENALLNLPLSTKD